MTNSMTAVSQPPWLNTIITLSQTAQERNEHACWLIDCSALPEKWLQRNIGNRRWLDLLGSAQVAHSVGFMPVLIAADNDPQRLQTIAREISRVASYANAVSFLTSPLPLASMQTVLRERSRIELPERLEVLLRFFDTRTLPLLPTLLTPAQYAAFTQDITIWHYLDRWGSLQQLPLAKSSDMSVVAQTPQRLVLNQTQEDMLIDDGLSDAVIDHLLTQGCGGLQDLLPPEQFDKVDPLVARARQQNIREHVQVFAFVANALQGVAA
jgi:Domain of unknown function (DUF4123)